MYVISLHYTAPLAQIDALQDGHVAWLQAAYADGLLLASGRKVPRSGGVILARDMPEDVLRTRLAQDPFWQHGVARYDITRFQPGMTSPELAMLREA